jgi:hypothetical protein
MPLTDTILPNYCYIATDIAIGTLYFAVERTGNGEQATEKCPNNCGDYYRCSPLNKGGWGGHQCSSQKANGYENSNVAIGNRGYTNKTRLRGFKPPKLLSIVRVGGLSLYSPRL